MKEKQAKRFAKPVILLALLLLLIALTKIKIPYDAQATGYIPLPDKDRDNVSVDFVGGVVQAIIASDSHGDTEEYKTMNRNWKVADGVAIQAQIVNVQACTTDYINNLEVNFTISNGLMEPTQGTVKVAVYDYNSRQLLSSRLMVLDFNPRTPTSGVAKFSLLSVVYDPIFLVKVTFPTPDELTYTPREIKYLSLIEYALVRMRLLTP